MGPDVFFGARGAQAAPFRDVYSVLRDGCLRGDSVDDDTVELIGDGGEPAGALSLEAEIQRFLQSCSSTPSRVSSKIRTS